MMFTREKGVQLLYTTQRSIRCHQGLLRCQRNEAVELGTSLLGATYEVIQSNTSIYPVESIVFPILLP
jgi:hypothetical protein